MSGPTKPEALACFGKHQRLGKQSSLLLLSKMQNKGWKRQQQHAACLG